MRPEDRGELREIFIEFNATQILFRTDVAEIAEYMLVSHAAMVAPRGAKVVGRLEVFHSRRGYACRGRDFLDFAGPATKLFPWLSREILDQFIRKHTDLLWIHAGVVRRREHALLIVAPSVQGKSTLATRLVESKWSYMSDEMAPVRMTADEVMPYPRTPVRRLDPGRAIETEVNEVLEREMCPLSPDSVRHSPSKVGLIVFPRFSYGSVARLSDMTPGTAALELARNCTNFSELRDAGVSRVASLALAVPCHLLDYGDGLQAGQALDSLASVYF